MQDLSNVCPGGFEAGLGSVEN